MKNLKFRAWDGERSKMYFGDLLRDRWYCDGGFLDVSMGGLEGLEIMQFTGLLDKNGKECYEGDIIQHSTTEGGLFNRVVSWSNEFQCTMLDTMPYYRFYESGYIQPSKLEFEIIGNIYESPSLLEQKQIA